MRVELPFGDEVKVLGVELPDECVTVARAKDPPGAGTWTQVVAEGLKRPIGVGRIGEQDLRGKRVAVLVDDWGRPTPADQVVPLILAELAAAGAADEDITFVAAAGMHDPMSEEDLARKLGAETVEKYRCVCHDGGDWEQLTLVGVSPQGTPIWVNRCVAAADYTIALGRIYLHDAVGYEGGYKMILPGVSSFETIVRDHGFNFSAASQVGRQDNPSRREIDAVGAVVGLSFLINVVVNSASQPVRAFCGEVLAAHRRGIAFGEREVWGALAGGPADIVVVSPGAGSVPSSGYDLEALHRAARAATESGTIICVAAEERTLPVERHDGRIDPAKLEDAAAFSAMLPTLTDSDMFRLHEKRNWALDRRLIQWRLKSVRGEFYRRRKMRALATRRVILTPDPEAALRAAVADFPDRQPTVTVLPSARTTLPQQFFEYSDEG